MKPNSFTKGSLISLLANDPEVTQQVREYLQGGTGQQLLQNGEVPHDTSETIFTEIPIAGEYSRAEAIVQLTGRPALLIQHGKWENPNIPALKDRLNINRTATEACINSVGRIEIANHFALPYYGSAWMLSDDILVTNRHVVMDRRSFGIRVGSVFHFRTTPVGEFMSPLVDFREEFNVNETFEVPIKEILHVEPDGDQFPDLALLRVEAHPNLPKPIELDTALPTFQHDVAAIGYPEYDPRNDVFVMEQLFHGIYRVKRLSPGRIIGVDPNGGIFFHDCTTLGGSSGSVLISLTSGKALGLHFEGTYLTRNSAVSSATILERLRALNNTGIFLTNEAGRTPLDQALGSEVPQPRIEDFKGKLGYDSNFLNIEVPIPSPNDKLAMNVTPIPGTDDNLLRYTHFSIQMHRLRKFAIFTAVNLDGSRLVRYDRGPDRWFPDPRLAPDLQTLDDLYAASRISGRRRLQRGHLVRRLDPMWGDTEEEILKAQIDTFYFTNCTPQHEAFNPYTWNELENYILDAADSRDFRVTIFTGPVFNDDDYNFQGRLIPEEFWKVVVIVNPSTRRLSATAYLLSQSRWIDRLEFIYNGYPDQVSIAEIEQKTNLSFGDLRQFDPLGRSEVITPRHPIRGPEDIIV